VRKEISNITKAVDAFLRGGRLFCFGMEATEVSYDQASEAGTVD
jgi:hypothetical protein